MTLCVCVCFGECVTATEKERARARACAGYFPSALAFLLLSLFSIAVFNEVYKGRCFLCKQRCQYKNNTSFCMEGLDMI